MISYSAGIGREDFDDLYRCYYEFVHHTALRILRSSNDAEDVVQSVFMKIWSAPRAFHGGNFEGWLTTLSKNCALDVIRRRKNHVSDSEKKRSREPCSDQSLEDLVLMRARQRWLRDAVDALPPTQRDAVVQAFWQDHTHAQIATLAALPLGTVKTRIRGGLHKLRQKSLREGFETPDATALERVDQ